jgi:hypothetical protein
MRYPDYTNLYVPSDLVDTYKKHPIFGRFEHIEDITQPENDDIKWEHTRYFVQDFYGMKIIWWIPFIKEDGNWYIDDQMRTYLHDELKVTRGLDTLCEAFSYDGIHAEMIIAISDNQNLIDEESGCLAKCRKASASSGAEYYVNLECIHGMGEIKQLDIEIYLLWNIILLEHLILSILVKIIMFNNSIYILSMKFIGFKIAFSNKSS